ncbi:putative Zn-dependent peptidase [Thermoplasmatales archaeon BRNA1]|nr:putative Zn-dependent peptidase [Thermoplasmatales archaeon BRNA1]
MSDNVVELSETGSGIPVVTENVPGANAAFLVAVRTGSRDEHDGIFGLSHLLEHTVFRETKNMTSFEMSKVMEGAGGMLNAFTAKEMTAYYGITLAETGRTAMDLVADIVANPLINEKDTEMEKDIVLQELSMVKSEPETYIHDLFEQNLWDGDPLGWDEGGTEESVKPLTYEDLRKYYEERYGLPNIAVFATGSFDKKEVVDWAENSFSGMSASVVNRREAPKMPVSKFRITDNGVDHANIGLGFPTPKVDGHQRTVNQVLSAVIGSGSSSRMFQEVREKNALVYAIYNQTGNYSDAGYVSTFLNCVDKNILKSLDECFRVYREFKREGLTEGELDRTKNILKGAIARGAETTDHRIYTMCNRYMTFGEVTSTSEKLADISSVTEEEVMAAAERYLVPERLNLTILGKVPKAVKNFDIQSVEL